MEPLLFYLPLLFGALGSSIGTLTSVTESCVELSTNGTCLPEGVLEGQFGANCTTNEMCNSTSHLVCGSENICECDSNYILYRGTCWLKIGSECLTDAYCMEEAECAPEEYDQPHRCTCLEQYFPSGNGTCERRKKLNESCRNDGECYGKYYYISAGLQFTKLNSFMVCQDGVCQCDDALAEEDIHDKDRFCGRRLHQSCKAEECLTGSICFNGTCRCDVDTHFESDDNNSTCEKRRPPGGVCRDNSHCMITTFCDDVTNLCTCPHGEVKSPESAQCLVSARNFCSTGSRYNPVKACVPNAECRQISKWTGKTSHICQCKENFTTSRNSDGYCYVKENEACSSNPVRSSEITSCLPGLACRNGGCTCLYKEHQVYNQSLEQCQSYVGGPCNASQDCKDSNAECVTEYEGVSQCRCKKGFIEANRECDVAYGEKCEEGVIPGCDRFAGLECSTQGICECPSFKVYNDKTASCQGLVGAVCKPVKEMAVEMTTSCVDGAYCRPFRGFEKVVGLCTCGLGLTPGKDRKCT